MIYSSTFCEISLIKNVFIEVSVRKRTRRGKTSDICQNFPENMRNFSKKFDVFPVFGGGKPLPPLIKKPEPVQPDLAWLPLLSRARSRTMFGSKILTLGAYSLFSHLIAGSLQ
jgi:hypothetical protein